MAVEAQSTAPEAHPVDGDDEDDGDVYYFKSLSEVHDYCRMTGQKVFQAI